MEWVYKIAGILSAVFGAFLILMLFAFASLMDPDIQGAARTSAIWQGATNDGTFPIGIVLIIAGLWLSSSKPRRPA